MEGRNRPSEENLSPIIIKQINAQHVGHRITIQGWVRTCRPQKNLTFVEINDGSTLSNFQAVIDACDPIPTGASLSVTGQVVKSPQGTLEIRVEEWLLFGDSPADFPLQKKRHSFEFLRTIAHLRPRTNTQGAIARVRSKLAYLTHQFFNERDFIYLQAPIITSSDCEGAGELFSVSSGKGHFFGKPAFLTVSGQLNAETYACALSRCYTFGPTFRAENSNTARHLAEFWMIEPEIAFASLPDVEQLAADFLKFIISNILILCPEDMQFFNTHIEAGIIERLEHILKTPVRSITYSEAIEILKKSHHTFEFPVEWGLDLQSEHERYLTEVHVQGPLIVTDYPKEIKAFYMRENPDGKTVAAMDLLVPKVGELIGGSQREERYDLLAKKIPPGLDWYMDLRKYGSVPHGGFGVGFERLVQFITGMENIRDVNAFPRTPNHAEY
ncbi:MAG: asparagine--tRNA ligase [Simkaniaceae bacterium]|nr:asparagine--tRNA ligase [Simkaniaceae bacterium]